jgi:hypothetical protein
MLSPITRALCEYTPNLAYRMALNKEFKADRDALAATYREARKVSPAIARLLFKRNRFASKEVADALLTGNVEAMGKR